MREEALYMQRERGVETNRQCSFLPRPAKLDRTELFLFSPSFSFPPLTTDTSWNMMDTLVFSTRHNPVYTYTYNYAKKKGTPAKERVEMEEKETARTLRA